MTNNLPDDAELRRRFHTPIESDTQAASALDVSAIIRGARRRRRPRLIAAAVGALAVATAIVVPVSVSAARDPLVTTATADGSGVSPESAEGGSAASESPDIDRAPADKLNLCGGTVAEVAPAASGLVLTVSQVDAAASDSVIPLVVTLTNTGTHRITGTSGSHPAVTFARDGITLWHSNGPTDLRALLIDLEPGASLQYTASFEPLICSADDDLAENFRSNLPAAGPGTFTLSAAIDITAEDGSTELITGPPTTITLR